jgi:hypothetical protein
MGSFRVLVERQRADPIAAEFLSVANSAIRLRALRFSPLLPTRSLRTIMKTSGSGRHGICGTFALGQTRSFDFVGSMSGLPESGHGWAIYEYMP